MVNPVPGVPISTPFGRRGAHWSCQRDHSGQGIHTGADFAAPTGTPVVAARAGRVKHTSYGSAFGPHQFAIVGADGWEDFYAHTTSRPAHGATVTTGQRVAAVGALGNVTGPHLHFERHRPGTTGWHCGAMVDPQPSITFQERSWFDMATEADLRRVVREELQRERPTLIQGVWSHILSGQTSAWHLQQTRRIVRRFLGPGGDAPETTLLQQIHRNTRPS